MMDPYIDTLCQRGTSFNDSASLEGNNSGTLSTMDVQYALFVFAIHADFDALACSNGDFVYHLAFVWSLVCLGYWSAVDSGAPIAKQRTRHAVVWSRIPCMNPLLDTRYSSSGDLPRPLAVAHSLNSKIGKKRNCFTRPGD